LRKAEEHVIGIVLKEGVRKAKACDVFDEVWSAAKVPETPPPAVNSVNRVAGV
jgi:hypothetical protein